MRQRTWHLAVALVCMLILASPVQARLPDEPAIPDSAITPRSLLSADVFIEKQGPFETTPGRVIGYSITFGNLGPDATGVEVRDLLPSQGDSYWLTWNWDNGPDQGFARRHGAGEQRELVWTGNLNAGDVHTIYVTLTVSANVPACHELEDEVRIAATTAPDSNPSNNTDIFVGPIVIAPDLGITKSAEGLAIPGDTITYTISYSTSCEVAEDVVITDVLPYQMVLISASPWPDAIEENTLVWRDAVLPLNRTEQIQVVGRVPPSALSGDVLTNTVTITNPLDNNPANNTAVVINIAGRADVTVSKNCPEYAIPGQFMEYVLTYANEGVVTARSTRLVDTLPQGVEFRGAITTPVQHGRELHWSLGDLAAGASDALTITVFVNESLLDSAILTNTATIMTETPEDDVLPNTAACSTTVQRTDLWLKQVVCPEAVIPGQTLTYRVEFGNQGVLPASEVVLTNCFPADVDLSTVAITSNPAALLPFAVTGDCYALALPDLTPGQTGWAEFSVQVRREAGAGATQVATTNTTEIATDTPEASYLNNRVRCVTAVNRSNIILLKQVSPTTAVMPGNEVTFTLTYTNEGAAEATDVVITDTLPASLMLVAERTIPAPTRSADVQDAKEYIWELGAVAPGAGGQVTLITRVVTQTWHAMTYTLTNEACIATSSPESDLTGHCDEARVQVIPGCPALITIEADPDHLPADRQSVSTITVTVTDVYSNHVMNGTPILMTTDLGEFRPGGGQSIVKTTRDGSFSVALAASATAGPATITAAFLGDSACGNVSATRVVTMEAAALAIVKTVTPEGAIEPGEQVTYTLVYTNGGQGVAMATTISDTLPPAGFAVENISSEPFINPSGRYPNYTWSVGNLEPNMGGVITITGRFEFTAPWQAEQEMRNCAAIASLTDDPDPTDNTTCVTNTLLTADVWITKKAWQYTTQPGDTLSWTILVGNKGPATARSVVVTDTLPAGVRFLASVPSPSIVPPPGIVFDIGDLAPDATYTITLFAKVECSVSARQELLNQVGVSADTREHDESNNQAEAVTTVIAPKLVVNLEPDMWPVCEGAEFIYKLWYANESDNASARNTVITATFDIALIVTPRDPGWQPIGGNAFTRNLGTVSPGSSGTFEFRCKTPVRTGAMPITLTSQAEISAISKSPCMVEVQSQPSVLVTNACDFIFLVFRRRLSGF